MFRLQKYTSQKSKTVMYAATCSVNYKYLQKFEKIKKEL